MSFLKPTPPPYDPLVWAQKPFPEKCRMVCQAWALQGYGSPPAILLIYVLKIFFYVAGWAFFCTFSFGSVETIAHWWLDPIAFQKAIVWSMFFEGLGLGCGSGPLTGRYFPPVGGFLYFLRPGTTKLSLFPKIFGIRRNWIDVALYLTHYLLLLLILITPIPETSMFVAPVVTLAILGVLDRTLFLVARGEHYFTTMVCFLFAVDWIAGSKAVHLALWFWAGVSKLNHHFPAVVCVMTSNNPLLPFPWLRKLMYQKYPDDLRPSWVAAAMAHGGGLLEFAVPIVLGLSSGGTGTIIGIILMLMLHGFITSNVPMGVPLEWNVMMVYGGFFLFWKNAAVPVLGIESPVLIVFLLVALVIVPLLGNLFPSWISFLLSMRYYAGNWAFSVWYFKGDSYRKLDQHLTKSAPWVYDQLSRFYDYSTSLGLVGKVLGFRAMHLHGRVLQSLLPKLVGKIEDYEHVDGELVAGMVLGWNFGDGHLHRDELLAAVQAQCNYAEGELRCLFVESQPLFGSKLHYKMVDAKSGLIEEGDVLVSELRKLQPWPTTQ